MFTKMTALSTELSTIIPQNSQIFVVIVHFGDPRPTTLLVDMLLGGTVVPRIVVVDHSEDTYTHPDSRVHFVYPKKNDGYFAGLRDGVTASAALGASDTDVFVLCNNDLAISAHSIEKIQKWWMGHGASGMVAGPFMGVVSLLSGRARVVSGYPDSSALYASYVHGACIVAQYATIKNLPFAGLFLYWEDVAYSLTCASIQYIPDLDIEHNDTPAPVSPDKLYYLVRNGAWTLERYTSPAWRLYWFVVNRIRLIYHYGIRKQNSSIVIQALKDSWKLNLN